MSGELDDQKRQDSPPPVTRQLVSEFRVAVKSGLPNEMGVLGGELERRGVPPHVVATFTQNIEGAARDEKDTSWRKASREWERPLWK